MKYAQLTTVGLIGILFLFLLNGLFTRVWQEQRDSELSNKADLVQYRLENALKIRVDSAQYLSLLFQLHPDATAQEFKLFAQSLMKYNPSLRALQFADTNTQVVFVYPPEGNEITITKPMVLIDDPLRGEYVKEAIEERKMTIQPPFELRQGGLGIIARNPIFISDKFTGLAIAVLDAPVIIEEALPAAESAAFKFSLADSEGNTFYHNLPDVDGPVEKRTISFANAEWTIKIAYTNNNTAYLFIERLLIFGLGCLALIFLLALLWYLQKRAEHLQKMVSERTRELQASERVFRTVSNYTVDWEYWISPGGTIQYTSPSCENITGYPRDELKTNKEILSKIHPDDKEAFYEHMLGEENEEENIIEFRIFTKSGNERWIGHNCQPVYDENGTFMGSRASNRDITSQKLLEFNLQKMIKEKDFLMRELNHRVKNNLMMVNSLIRLKNESLGDGVDLSDISHQINTIRIVHEKLYKTAAITQLHFRDYVEDLMSTIFSFTDMHVQVKNNIEVEEISTKTTIPLGLIMNEVANNAIKYGFKPDEQAIFTIEMRKENDDYVLILANNGNLFPEAVDFENSDTLGLRLIKALTKQLDGTVELKKRPYTVFTIRFPVDQ